MDDSYYYCYLYYRLIFSLFFPNFSQSIEFDPLLPRQRRIHPLSSQASRVISTARQQQRYFLFGMHAQNWACNWEGPTGSTAVAVLISPQKVSFAVVLSDAARRTSYIAMLVYVMWIVTIISYSGSRWAVNPWFCQTIGRTIQQNSSRVTELQGIRNMPREVTGALHGPSLSYDIKI